MTNENSDSLTLRVAKAIPSDVGHGRARVPFDNDLNLKPGDIIEVSGERKTVLRLYGDAGQRMLI